MRALQCGARREQVNIELSFEEEPETVAAIEDAVKSLLQGLGEDINREGLRRTPLRVAKALREGTRVKLYAVRDGPNLNM
ncbi:GTP cyclohydrolase 1 [Camellia lanceoleosa]|uniref:GTP cyclohydrolase 1 n=1 Tax=Camellia lanceoleosa TaxID=1840588 RepID=A0ACC0HMQ5_9ERIC|nr:GTP cyclohydrolase 1 [Camellia lanceoleosa]